MGDIPEQVIFLILFVVVGAIKWLIEKIKGPQAPHEVSDTLEDMYDDFREEIRQRQTQSEQKASVPPPLPRTDPVPPPIYVASTPPASAHPDHFSFKKNQLSAEEQAAIERFQNLDKQRKDRPRSAATGSVRDMLASPGSARKAVILKEILGEPRSMQQI
jgi:deoxyribodipyrimidine photolyase